MAAKSKKLIHKNKYVDEAGEEYVGKTYTNSLTTLDGTQKYFTLGEEDQAKYLKKVKTFLDAKDIV